MQVKFHISPNCECFLLSAKVHKHVATGQGQGAGAGGRRASLVEISIFSSLQ